MRSRDAERNVRQRVDREVAPTEVRYATVGRGADGLEDFLAKCGWRKEEQNKVCKDTQFLIVRSLENRRNTKLDQARERDIRVVEEAFVRTQLGKRKDWGRDTQETEPEDDACARRFAGPNGEAHLRGVAALANGCTTAATRAHAEALACLAIMPAMEEFGYPTRVFTRGGATYMPLGHLSDDLWSDGFHDWTAVDIVRWFRHPGCAQVQAAIDAWEKRKGPRPTEEMMVQTFYSHHPHLCPKANKDALHVANTQAGLLGDLMRRYRRCGLRERCVTYGPPMPSTITWVIAMALRMRRAAVTALQALACHARKDAAGARRLCAFHDAAEARIARAVPLEPHCGRDDQYVGYEPVLALVQADEHNRLAAAPLALAHLLAHDDCRLPAEWYWLSNFVRFLCQGLVEPPGDCEAAQLRTAVLPHLAAAVDAAMGDGASVGASEGARCDYVVATAAAFGCPNAQQLIRGTPTQCGAVAPAAWGACLPADGPWSCIVPPAELGPRPPAVPHGPVAVLALVAVHLHYLVRSPPPPPPPSPVTSAPSDGAASHEPPPTVSPVADAMARAGKVTTESVGKRYRVTIDRLDASTGTGTATSVSLEGLRERAWRDLVRLLKANDQWKNPTKEEHDGRYRVYMKPDVWETLRQGLVQRRAEIKQKDLAMRLRAHASRMKYMDTVTELQIDHLNHRGFLDVAGTMFRNACQAGPDGKDWFRGLVAEADRRIAIAKQARNSRQCQLYLAFKQLSLALGGSL